MTFIWTPDRLRGGTVDAACCRAAVQLDTRWPNFHQCSRKATVTRPFEGQEYGFCKQHDPVALEAKRLARDQAWKAKWGERERRLDLEAATKKALAACRSAIEKIAAGHNDPRQLAIETLALFPAGRAALDKTP